MAMPAKYRDRLHEICAGQLIVTIDRSSCLLLYPQPVWEEVEQKLIQLSSTNMQARNLKRFLLGHAEECEMDGQGRILISAPLREYAFLEKSVSLIGQGHRFELWDKERFDQATDNWRNEKPKDSDLSGDLEFLTF
jgi:MraZ protein